MSVVSFGYDNLHYYIIIYNNKVSLSIQGYPHSSENDYHMNSYQYIDYIFKYVIGPPSSSYK